MATMMKVDHQIAALGTSRRVVNSSDKYMHHSFGRGRPSENARAEIVADTSTRSAQCIRKLKTRCTSIWRGRHFVERAHVTCVSLARSVFRSNDPRTRNESNSGRAGLWHPLFCVIRSDSVRCLVCPQHLDFTARIRLSACERTRTRELISHPRDDLVGRNSVRHARR